MMIDRDGLPTEQQINDWNIHNDHADGEHDSITSRRVFDQIFTVDGQTVDWDAKWEQALTKSSELSVPCPLCGAVDSLRYDEYVLSYRRARGISPTTGQLVVDSYSEEVWESTKGGEIYCESCLVSMPIPKRGIEWQ